MRIGQQVRIIQTLLGPFSDVPVRLYSTVKRARVELFLSHLDEAGDHRSVCVRDMKTDAPYWYPADSQLWVERHGILEYHA